MSSGLTIKKSVIEIGLERPIKFLHITDAHIDVINAIGKEENTCFFQDAMRYAREKGMFVVCTGDNFKGVSSDNIAYASENIPDGNHIFLPGNHDFCACPDNLGLSDPTYWKELAKRWRPCYKQDLYFDSKIIGGVNFVSLRNVYYAIDSQQVGMLRAEVAKGYPIVLCMHIPLFTTEKANQMLSTWARCAYMVAPPKEYYTKYTERHKSEQIPTKETLEAVEYIGKESAIKAIVAGHIHEDLDGFADCGKRQITTAPLKDGVVREIEIV